METPETFTMSVEFIKDIVQIADKHRKQIRIGYVDKKGNPEMRFVEPFDATHETNFSAFCNLRKSFRHFSYDRVVRIVLTDIDQTHVRKDEEVTV